MADDALPGADYDLAVVGAGPAGMSAAIVARARGLKVLVLDSQRAVGGQIYRAITRTDARRLDILGPEYAHGQTIAQAFAASGADYWPGAVVWQITRERTLHVLVDDATRTLRARRIVLATGAMERPFPVPGWTLPGVMTAGAAQILLKESGIAPAQPVVVAGCGPLLYLLSWQYLRAGIPIRAILDTTASRAYVRAARHLAGALTGWRDLSKGIGMLRALKSAHVPFYDGVTDLAIEGEDSVTGVGFRRGGRTFRIETPLVLLHQGVVPDTQMTWSLRAGHAWDEEQLCWKPVRDAWGELDVPGIYMAGDGAGIGGAKVAALQGRIAGVAVSASLGACSAAERDGLAAPWRADMQRHERIRPFLDALYRPLDENRIPRDDVTICRCEEVTAGMIRANVALGCTGPNQVKSFSRCGMGPCQGRECGLTVTEVIARARGVSPAETGYYRVRAPIRPITLAQLAEVSPLAREQ